MLARSGDVDGDGLPSARLDGDTMPEVIWCPAGDRVSGRLCRGWDAGEWWRPLGVCNEASSSRYDN